MSDFPVQCCLNCRHCVLDLGESDWSDVTPGGPASWSCSGPPDAFYRGEDDGGRQEILEDITKNLGCPWWEADR